MDKLFGSRVRTDTLVATSRLGTTYISELARILKRRPIEIRRALQSLEVAGVVTTRRFGTLRVVEMDDRFPESEELAKLLLKISERPLYHELWKALRRRPRAIGKAAARPSKWDWLKSPPPGSKVRAARDFGVDLTLLAANLRLSPVQRLRRLSGAANSLNQLRTSNKCS